MLVRADALSAPRIGRADAADKAPRIGTEEAAGKAPRIRTPHAAGKGQDKSARNESWDFYAYMTLAHARRFARCFCRYVGNIAAQYILYNQNEG